MKTALQTMNIDNYINEIDIKDMFNNDWEIIIEDVVKYEKKNETFKVNQYLFKKK